MSVTQQHNNWRFMPALWAAAFAERPDEPLPIWASKNVFLDRRVTTRPGYYDPGEFPWTWEFQEILRTRQFEGQPVRQVTVMKSSVAGFTEGALNAVRFAARHDPQNVIFAIDSRTEAGNVNEIRLQPTLRRLGEQIFTDDDDDASKFLLKLRRMLIYFFGSYSAGAFANKMAELVIADELEEHGQPTADTSNIENLRSRIKSAERGLLVLLSKPKMVNGPIDAEHKKGSMHIPEIACPHCEGFQQLEQDNMKFDHCKNLMDEWDLDRVLKETYFECVHCHKPIEEKHKRQMFKRENRRWRRTNLQSEPGHISMQVSDFLSYLISWGELANKYIRSKGDHVARQGYRNHHEGLPYEIRETKTEAGDIITLRGDYKLGTLPWMPDAIVLGADVGLEYVKWTVTAIRRANSNEAAVIDYGKELHPDDILTLIRTKHYACKIKDPEGNEKIEYLQITVGGIDAKYRKDEVTRTCLNSQRKLFPTAGINADLAVRSISFNSKPPHPPWFGVIVYVDRDAKHELYTDRISGWSSYIRDPSRSQPQVGRLSFFSEINEAVHWTFVNEHTQEHLVELPTAHAAKQFVWKRKGPNHWPDATKVGLVLWRYLTRNDPVQP
jgi:hypothetical protein